MEMTRKSFLIGSMAVAAAGARRMFAVPAGTVCGTPQTSLDITLPGNTGTVIRLK